MPVTDYISVADAVDLLPRRRGKKIHVKTVVRWIVTGCRGVTLAAVRIGSCWFTTARWLDEFQRECSRRSKGIIQERPQGVARAGYHAALRQLEQRHGISIHTEEGA